jgi:O-antigen ligase/tetratricopeptide (TPR) repeat protein
VNEYQVDFDDTNFVTGRFDIAIELLIAALLAFMPLAFGVRTAFSKEVVIFLSGAIAVCFLLRSIFYNESVFKRTWAYIPVFLFLFITIIQIVPLPSYLVGSFSPNTTALKNELLSDLPASDNLLNTVTFSFYSNATKHDLRLVFSVVLVFMVVLGYYHRPERIKRLLLTIALIGGFVAAIALAQDLFGNGKIYWFVSGSFSKPLSGPFINHNHYGQFMNLSIGAALALICVKVHECFSDRKIIPSFIYEFLGSNSAKFIWFLVVIMALGAASIFVSLTRGGMVSMIIASAFVTLLLASRPSLKGRGWIMVIMALGAFICILSVGFDAVYDRIATLNELNEYEGRIQILKDLTASYRQFPVFGTGLGTHSVVYPMFKQINNVLLYTHAENEYAQVLEETGLIGLVILIIFGIIIAFNFARAAHCAGKPVCSAVYGLGFGLVAILIHSFSDFGQHMPANAFLSAIFCALIIALAIQSKRKNLNMQTVSKFRFLHVFLLLVLCGIWFWVLNDANDARIAESYWTKVRDTEKRIKENQWKGTQSEYAELIANTKSALAYQPDNMKYQYWLNVYRWRSISQETDPQTGAVIIPEESKFMVREIVDGFYKACIICPTYGPPYSVVGQIEKFILNQDSGAEKIRKGFYLAPSDPVSCFVAGNLDVLEGKIEDSIPKFEKAVQLDADLFRSIVNIYVYQLSRPELALSAAGEEIGRLNYVTIILDDMQYRDMAEKAREKIINLLELQCNEPDTPGSVFAQLGGIYSKQDDNMRAAECYRKALAREYSQVYWRLELAKLLVKMDEIPEAMSEAKICLQLRPRFKAAENLVADLSIHPQMLAQKEHSP